MSGAWRTRDEGLGSDAKGVDSGGDKGTTHGSLMDVETMQTLAGEDLEMDPIHIVAMSLGKEVQVIGDAIGN